jgi:hypothetical protein
MLYTLYSMLCCVLCCAVLCAVLCCAVLCAVLCRFPCTGADVKRRIETLIEREYLERDKADSSVYNYLA